MSPFVFNKCLRLVLAYLRNKGLRLALFVDDFFQMMRPDMSLEQVQELLSTLEWLGWDINTEKSQLQPGVMCEFIGFKVHSSGVQGPWLQVLPHKIKKLKRGLRYVLHNAFKAVNVRLLARLAGQCIAMTKAIVPAKLLLRNVYRTIATKTSWDDCVYLDEKCVLDLKWWLRAVSNWNGAPLMVRQPEIQVETDASGFGWGAVCHALKIEASGYWTRSVRAQSSNF